MSTIPTGSGEHTDVVVIGGGQAGLATSYYLKQRGRQHLIIEQARLGEAWLSGRWDSFKLITPNARTFTLPGLPYEGDDPTGFAPLSEIQSYLRRYIALLDPPARLGVRATSLRQHDGAGYVVDTTSGPLYASDVVVATGLLQRPKIPPFAAALASDVVQMPASEYRNPRTLPDGNVLVVGSGQSGCPIAEELNRSGRRVYLSLGNTGRAPSRYRGRSKIAWLVALGLPAFAADGVAKGGLASDPGGGHDYSPHRFARDGITLLGHLIGARGHTLLIASDLHDLLSASDRSEMDFKKTVDNYVRSERLEDPEEPPAEVLDDAYQQDLIVELDLRAAGVTSVVWCTGYGFDFSWVRVPVLDDAGYPVHESGVTPCPGLYFVGMHWRSRPATAFVGGVGPEAEHVAAHIAERALSVR